MTVIPQEDGTSIDTATGEIVLPEPEATQEELTARDAALADAFADDEAMAALLADPAVAWIPQEAGDAVIGVVTGRWTKTGPTKTGEDFGPHEVIELRIASGKLLAVHMMKTVQRTLMERHNPQIGDRIGIIYKGERRKVNATPAMIARDKADYSDFNMVVYHRAG